MEGERKKRLHGTNERPRAYYRLYLQQPTANSPVRQMQPYVVAVLINAATNPLGVDSFIFFSFTFFSSVHRPPLLFSTSSLFFLLFLISLAEQQSDYAGPDPEEGLLKLGKTAGKCGKYAEKRHMCWQWSIAGFYRGQGESDAVIVECSNDVVHLSISFLQISC